MFGKQKNSKKILGDDYSFFAEKFGVQKSGNWEHGNNILIATKWQNTLANADDIDDADDVDEIRAVALLEKLRVERDKRIPPLTDDKTLASWNGLMLKALCDAYEATGDEHYKDLAQKNAEFLLTKLYDGAYLKRSYKQGIAKIRACLEDYAALIHGLIAYYQVSSEQKYLQAIKSLTEYSIEHFYDAQDGMFFYTDKTGEQLIARKKELFDNVIPSSNAIMASNLYAAAFLLEQSNWKMMAEQMLSPISLLFKEAAGDLTYWANLYSSFYKGNMQVVVIGEKHEAYRKELAKYFLPHKLLLSSKAENADSPLLKSKVAIDGKTSIYVCQNNSCKMPVYDVEAAMELIKQ